MFMRLAFLLFLLVVTNVSFAQKFRSKIYFAAIYDNVQIHQIPSYIEIPALDFRIYNQRIYNTATPQLSFELGYGIEKNWKGSKKLYTGLRSEEHTSELQSRLHLVCRLLLEKKKNN